MKSWSSQVFQKNKVLLWVDSPVGTGHLGAMSQVAKSLERRGFEVCVASGSLHNANNFSFGLRSSLVKLPGIYLGEKDKYFSESGKELSRDIVWQKVYRSRLETTFKSFCPDILIFEMWPIGRQRYFNNILLSLVDRLKAAKHYCLVRDIISGKNEREITPEEHLAAKIINRFFAGVFVRGGGNPPLATTFKAANLVSDKVHHIGFIVPDSVRKDDKPDHDREILVTGSMLKGAPDFYNAVLNAIPYSTLSFRRRPWRMLVSDVCGRDVYEHLGRKAATLDTKVIVERTRPDFFSLLTNAYLMIAQGGSTLPQAVAALTPTVVIPSDWEGNHGEQALRATAFAEKGLTVQCSLQECIQTPRTIAAAMEMSCQLNLVNGCNTQGAENLATYLVASAAAPHNFRQERRVMSQGISLSGLLT